MRFTTYVYHIINQLRLLLGFAVLGSLLLLCGVSSYPLQPLRSSSVFSGAILVVSAYTALRVILGMQRDEILNRLVPATRLGGLSLSAVRQIATYVILPSAFWFSRIFPDFGDAFSRTFEPLLTLLR